MTTQIMTTQAPLIVHAVRQYPPRRGGLEDFVSSLAREQLAQGLRVRVVTADRDFSRPAGRLAARETLDGVEVVRLRAFGSPRYPVMPGVFRALAGADLVHVHAIDFFFDALALTRPLHGKPLVATTHGGFFHSGDFSALKAVWFNTLTRLSVTSYRAIVGCSVNDVRLFEPLGGARVRLIENGVNLGKFADAASRTPVKSLVTIGRFSKNKRLDHLLDAMRVLARQDAAWRLAIVGVPADHSVEEVRAMISARGLDGAVALHAGLPDAGVRAVIGGASLFVSASEFEGFGLALVEAMSAGLLPVVEANATFADFSARHGAVRLTDFSEPAVAAAAIAAGYAAHEAAGPAGRAALMAAAQPFAWPSVAKAYAQVYREALPSGAGTLLAALPS